MLDALTSDGYLSWTCPKCGESKVAHASHEDVQVRHIVGRPLAHRLIALPACDCGKRIGLKCDFTPEELAASNMIDNGRPTATYAAAHRHMALVQHLEAIGKPVQNTVVHLLQQNMHYQQSMP